MLQYNDFKFYNEILYYNKLKIRNAALEKLKRHLQYLNIELSTFLLIDDRIPSDDKQRMINNLNWPQKLINMNSSTKI